MNSAAWWLNTAWMLKCLPEWAAFDRASRHVADAQARLLRQILTRNRDTVFGRAHRFDTITGVDAYQKQVPLAKYEDFAPSIDAIAAGETNVLTSEPVRLLEPTSGTSGGEKLIPYTAGLRLQFQRGVAAWIADLFRRRPAVRRGRAYWSISPAFGPPRRSPGGLPIGFDDDIAYLGWAERFALRRLLVGPPAGVRSSAIDSFRYVTLLSLLAAGDLSLISVWSPTFLSTLIAPLDFWQDRLCCDLRHGSVIPANPARADRVARILRSSASLADRLRQVWPELAVISCWADAGAAIFIPDLLALFPTMEVQPKGLLATEGFVSFPLADDPGAALAVRCHFFEFEEVDAPRCRLAHELDQGGRYRVVLTTAGGLYRYRLGDEVQVVGFHRQCPVLKFVGKADAVSDLVGEKLSEPHVRSVMDRLAAAFNFRPRFALVAPVMNRPARYRLYLQAPGVTSGSLRVVQLQNELEVGLGENPYYRHAVAVGQLAPADVAVLDNGGECGWLLYERRCLEEGQKCGDIKPVALDRRPGWPEVFVRLENGVATSHK
jgi:hypothetical protein